MHGLQRTNGRGTEELKIHFQKLSYRRDGEKGRKMTAYEFNFKQGQEQARADLTNHGRAWVEDIVWAVLRDATPSLKFDAYDYGYINEILNLQEVGE